MWLFTGLVDDRRRALSVLVVLALTPTGKKKLVDTVVNFLKNSWTVCEFGDSVLTLANPCVSVALKFYTNV
jgi:hypothetical protein